MSADPDTQSDRREMEAEDLGGIFLQGQSIFGVKKGEIPHFGKVLYSNLKELEDAKLFIQGSN